MAMQPEFSDLAEYQSIIELVENDDMIVHLLQEGEISGLPGNLGEIKVSIGSRNGISGIEQCSVVSTNYSVGNVTGTIGLVGPTRMNYPKMVALVEQLANRFNK